MKRALFLAALLASCRPGAIDWGLDAIDGMQTPDDDPALGCGVVVTEQRQDERAHCTFGSGARASETLGIDRATLAKIPIRHVLIVMKENRSFDHIFGALHDQGQRDVDPIPTDFSNPNLAGERVYAGHANTTCYGSDPSHQSQGMLACLDGGKMDGFVINAQTSTPTDGSFVMRWYEQSDLPFYYFLANTFAIADRHFAPMATGTYANRDIMLFGTAAGVVDSGITYPPPSTPSIFHTLMHAGFTWGAYTDGSPFSSALGWDHDMPGVHSLAEIYDALDRGTLPNVAFVDGIENVDDDHPPSDIQVGEAWMKKLYDHALKSPQWDRLALIYTYDEGGGFFDHLPPPDACRSEPWRSPPAQRGARVPLVMISPWAKRHYVSHVVRDHTSITRFIEALFDLPALTPRDANADALLDMFDFTCGLDRKVPHAALEGRGGCE